MSEWEIIRKCEKSTRVTVEKVVLMSTNIRMVWVNDVDAVFSTTTSERLGAWVAVHTPIWSQPTVEWGKISGVPANGAETFRVFLTQRALWTGYRGKSFKLSPLRILYINNIRMSTDGTEEDFGNEGVFAVARSTKNCGFMESSIVSELAAHSKSSTPVQVFIA